MNVKTNKNDNFKNFLPYVVLAGVIAIVLFALNMQGTKVHELKTGELITELKENIPNHKDNEIISKDMIIALEEYGRIK